MPQRPALIVRRRHIVRCYCAASMLWLSLAIAPGRVLGGGTCPSNINGDNIVDINDLLAVIGAWGACTSPCPPTCPADIAPAVGNCTVDVDDLLVVIGGWGPCPVVCPPPLTNCGGVCVNTNYDSQHCGGCFIVCPPDHVCSGSCVPGEPPPPGG